jgi:hypothetical protein
LIWGFPRILDLWATTIRPSIPKVGGSEHEQKHNNDGNRSADGIGGRIAIALSPEE